MKKNRFICLICFAVNVCIGCKTGQSPSNIHTDTINSLMREYKVPVVGTAIIDKGIIKEVMVLGDLPKHKPAPDKTLFNIASLTKPLTATMVLMLVDRGQWQLDEPLANYWTDPDVAGDARSKKLSTRHVLSHQSGLPNWRGHEPGGKLAFAFEPGTQWKYSGEGFEYLRKALEHKFNIPFEKLVDSLLFKPLNMNDTRYFWDDTVDSTLYANRYQEDGTAFPQETWYEANPSNLVLTTVKDYAEFGVGIMNGSLLSDSIYKEMTTNQAILPDHKEWGLSWRLVNQLSNGEYALVHTGGNPGIRTIILLLPKSKRGIVVFTNGAKGDQLYERLIGEWIGIGNEIIQKMK